MKRLLGVTLLFLFSSMAYADIPVEAEDGRLLWADECASSYKFSYFATNRIQRACIESTETVSIERFVLLARMHDCFGQVRVDYGTIRDGVLYASEITEVRGCHDPCLFDC